MNYSRSSIRLRMEGRNLRSKTLDGPKSGACAHLDISIATSHMACLSAISSTRILIRRLRQPTLHSDSGNFRGYLLPITLNWLFRSSWNELSFSPRIKLRRLHEVSL